MKRKITKTLGEAIEGGMFNDLPKELLWDLSKSSDLFIEGVISNNYFNPTSMPAEVSEAYRKLAMSYGHPYTNVSSFRWQTLPAAIKYAEMMEESAKKAKKASDKIIKEYTDYKKYFHQHSITNSPTNDLRKLAMIAAEIKHIRKLRKQNEKDRSNGQQVKDKRQHYDTFIEGLQRKLTRHL